MIKMESKKIISNTSVVVMWLLILFLCVQFINSEEKETTLIEEGIFKLKYYGHDNSKEELKCNTWHGYMNFYGPFKEGESPEVSDFVKNLNLKSDKFVYIQNPHLKNAEYSAIEYQNNKAIALYIDLNANGKLDEGEKIQPQKSENTKETYFFTPDFEIKSPDGKKYPYRYIISTGYSSPMWSSACVMEGNGKIGGKPYRVILLDTDTDGDFTSFVSDNLVIMSDEQQENKSFNRITLSRIISLNSQFYKISFSDDKTVLKIEKDTTPLGFLKPVVLAKSDVNIRDLYFSLRGVEDLGIYFNIHTEQSKTEKLPALNYNVSYGSVRYGPEEQDKQWQVSFQDSQPFGIQADKTTELEFDELKLKPQAINERYRYTNEQNKYETTYKRGTEIYISREIKGKSGEKYGRFIQGNNWREVEPQVIIKDDTGKQIYSGSMQYG